MLLGSKGDLSPARSPGVRGTFPQLGRSGMQVHFTLSQSEAPQEEQEEPEPAQHLSRRSRHSSLLLVSLCAHVEESNSDLRRVRLTEEMRSSARERCSALRAAPGGISPSDNPHSHGKASREIDPTVVCLQSHGTGVTDYGSRGGCIAPRRAGEDVALKPASVRLSPTSFTFACRRGSMS